MTKLRMTSPSSSTPNAVRPRATVTRHISALEQRRTAQRFTVFSCLAVLSLPLLIPMFIWVAASIVMYAAAAHHPNPRVAQYVRLAGYRFYATFALLVIMGFFGFILAEWMGRLNVILFVWLIAVLLVVPLGVRDWVRAHKEHWQAITVEVEA